MTNLRLHDTGFEALGAFLGLSTRPVAGKKTGHTSSLSGLLPSTSDIDADFR